MRPGDRGYPHPNAELQAHYNRNAEGTGHAADCRRRIVPTLFSDHKSFDAGRCERCQTITARRGA